MNILSYNKDVAFIDKHKLVVSRNTTSFWVEISGTPLTKRYATHEEAVDALSKFAFEAKCVHFNDLP